MITGKRAFFGLVYIFILNILLVHAYNAMELNTLEETVFFFVYLIVAIIAVFPALDILQYGFHKNYVCNFLERCGYLAFVISLGIFIWGRTDDLRRIWGFVAVIIAIVTIFGESKEIDI